MSSEHSLHTLALNDTYSFKILLHLCSLLILRPQPFLCWVSRITWYTSTGGWLAFLFRSHTPLHAQVRLPISVPKSRFLLVNIHWPLKTLLMLCYVNRCHATLLGVYIAPLMYSSEDLKLRRSANGRNLQEETLAQIQGWGQHRGSFLGYRLFHRHETIHLQGKFPTTPSATHTFCPKPFPVPGLISRWEINEMKEGKEAPGRRQDSDTLCRGGSIDRQEES